MEINSGYERPFARLGQAELARILPSHLQYLQVRGSELGLITLMSVANTSFSSAPSMKRSCRLGSMLKLAARCLSPLSFAVNSFSNAIEAGFCI